LRDKTTYRNDSYRNGPDAFDLSLAMEILSGIPKEEAIDMIIKAGKEL